LGLLSENKGIRHPGGGCIPGAGKGEFGERSCFGATLYIVLRNRSEEYGKGGQPRLRKTQFDNKFRVSGGEYKIQRALLKDYWNGQEAAYDTVLEPERGGSKI